LQPSPKDEREMPQKAHIVHKQHSHHFIAKVQDTTKQGLDKPKMNEMYSGKNNADNSDKNS
jgi:hypothetical protein